MKIDIDELRDVIMLTRLRIADDDLTPEEALDEIEKEINRIEIENY